MSLILTPLRALPGVLALGAAVIGCSSSADRDETEPKVSPECEVMAEQCFDEQRVCVGAGSAARCDSCPPGQKAASGTDCAPIPGVAHYHDFGVISLAPGEEHDGICQSWTLNNDEAIWYGTVELVNAPGGYHHSNWFFVPEHLWDEPDGSWSCRDREFDEALAAFRGGTLYAQTTQIRHQVQQFPEGVAIQIPPRHRIIGATHVFNTTPDPIESRLELTIYEVEDPGTITTELHPFRLNVSDINIAPQGDTAITGLCDFDAAQKDKTGKPFSMELYYSLPHYHELGTGFRLEKLGGPDDGEVLFEIDSPEPRGHTFTEPVDMAGSSGFRFTCKYTNPRAEEVHYGIGDQEMCVMLGFARSTVLYDGNVKATEPMGLVDGTTLYEGNCEIIAAAMLD